MQANKLIKSAYLHIPFCKNICSYCDFCKNFYNEKIVLEYLDSLKEEVNDKYKNDLLKTVYIGGGTPSSLSINALDKLFDITNNLLLEEEYEFTFECNYEDINEELLLKLKENKVNRISIGIQSFNSRFSSFLERKIDKEEMINKINLTKKYFDNINIDLMYGIDNQTLEELKEDINLFINQDVSHISTYALILEEHTKLSNKVFNEISDEIQSNMYHEIVNSLKENGYKHYELSNFSKEGYESKHNLTYWNNENYYGFGAGASGFIANKRYENTKSIFNYIKVKKEYFSEELDNDDLINDEVMLNLRKTNGINKNEFKEKYNKFIEELFDYKPLTKEGIINETNTNIFINEKYLFVSNEVIIKFLDTKK